MGEGGCVRTLESLCEASEDNVSSCEENIDLKCDSEVISNIMIVIIDAGIRSDVLQI